MFTAIILAAPPAGGTTGTTVDLKSGWDQFWATVNASLGGVLVLMQIAGALIVVGAVIAGLFERKRSGGIAQGNKTSALVWAMIIGGILAAPAIIGIILGLLDFVINGIIGVLGLGSTP